MSQNQIQNVGQIKEGLQCNIALEKLDLSSNVIDDSGLIKMAQALRGNGCLETISISFNDYGLDGMKEFFGIFTAPNDEVLANTTLQNISFSIPDRLSSREQSELGMLILDTLKSLP